MTNTYINLSDPVLISGGAPAVSVSGPAPSAGMVIAATSSNTAIWADVSSGTVVLTGDVNGTAAANTLVSISSANLPFLASLSSPTLLQTSESTVLKGQDLTLQPQQSTHATNQGGGNLVVALQVPTGTGAEAALQIKRGGNLYYSLQALTGAPTTYAAMYMGANVSPGGSNYVLLSDGAITTQLNAPTSGNIVLTVGQASVITCATNTILASQAITLKNTILNDVTAIAVTTTDATLTTLYTAAALAPSSLSDYVVSVWGLDPTHGDAYRADFSFTYQRIASAAPSAVGATAVPLNVRGTTNGLTWGGASIAVSGNTILVQVQGISSITIDWKCSVSSAVVV